jgi:uncharacterized membrane protein YeiH
MQPIVVDSENLFRLVHFCDVVAAVVFAVSGLSAGRFPAMIAAFLVTFTVRGLAIKLGWSLPVFRETTKRERWKSDRKDAARE